MPVKSKVEILQNVLAFSEYMNFNIQTKEEESLKKGKRIINAMIHI